MTQSKFLLTIWTPDLNTVRYFGGTNSIYIFLNLIKLFFHLLVFLTLYYFCINEIWNFNLIHVMTYF